MKPLVSIIIPVYNGANYMREAIDSALAQTYKAIEILVINDGSTDDGKTEQIAMSYGDKIRYISKGNGGSSSALNIGIKNMKGDFFSWLSHDDIYMTDKIERQMEAMSVLNPKDTVVVCSGKLIDANGNLIFSKPDRVHGLKTSSEALTRLSHGKGINGCGILISKSLIGRTGFFDERMMYLNDLDYWWRLIMEDVNVFYMPDKLVKTRIHSSQVSATKIELLEKECHYLANKLLKHVYQKKINRRVALMQIAYFCSMENLTLELRQVKQALSVNGNYNIATCVYIQIVRFLGCLKRFLKWTRKKILFSR